MLQFLETQRESIGKTAVREIIGGSDRAVAFEDKAKAAIASIDEAKPFFDDLVKAINENTVNLQAQRQFDAGIQAAQTDGTVAIEGQARAIYEQALDKIDIPGFDYGRRMLENRDLDQALYRGTSPVQAVREQLVHATTPIGLGEKPISREAEAILASALKSLDKLQIALDRMEANQRAVPFAPQINVNVKAPPMRPKEAPLPAATAP